MSEKTRNGRIFELDFLRGLALVMMCLDHLAYDLSCLPYWFPDSNSELLYSLSEFGWEISMSDWRLVLHYIFATLFLILAGIGSALTRHPLKRVAHISVGAFTITFATVLLDLFFDMDATILFGVLSAMAVGAAMCLICSLFGEKWGKWIALAGGVAVICIGFSIRWYDAVSLYNFHWEILPDVIIGTLRYGSDWFPVFPCTGIILVGYFLGKILYKKRQSLVPVLRGKTDHFFCVIGKYPLWIYIFHQPVIMAVLYGIIFVFARS